MKNSNNTQDSTADSAEQKTNTPSKLWIWLAVLALLIIGTFAIYFLMPNKAVVETPNSIYAAYYQPYPNKVDENTAGKAGENLAPFELYETGQYKEAISGFMPNLADETVRWYFGQSMHASGHLPGAKKIYRQFLSDDESPFFIHSRFYLGLVHLKNGDKQEAEYTFKILAEGKDNTYQEKALEILDKMSRIE